MARWPVCPSNRTCTREITPGHLGSAEGQARELYWSRVWARVPAIQARTGWDEQRCLEEAVQAESDSLRLGAKNG